MKKVNVIVLKTAGTNNDLETAQGFRLAGADADIVHINKLLRNEVNIKKSEYKILAIPGGFSYGDDISAGKIFANKLKYKLEKGITEFAKSGKLIIGICNGFQVLVKSGLLPFTDGNQSATLTYNDSGKFECRWVYLKTMRNAESGTRNFWVKGLPEIIQLPVAHGEGKFVCYKNAGDLIKRRGLIVFKYVDEYGEEKGYPYNPNGSFDNIAGITNTEGNIFGLMPHPERFAIKYHHPFWTRNKNTEPYGLQILKNAVNYSKENL
ncbi:MAG: phosphoribosylformylglycinamidine synthase I [Elusimicrobia bacterium]|nr:phosphoribosylformylglycinamidine synthase I [Elusimicrobiota bacterium]